MEKREALEVHRDEIKMTKCQIIMKSMKALLKICINKGYG